MYCSVLSRLWSFTVNEHVHGHEKFMPYYKKKQEIQNYLKTNWSANMKTTERFLEIWDWEIKKYQKNFKK